MDPAANPSSLRRLYEKGEWSDLTIETETKAFKVHKAVVCLKSSFFHAACSRDFGEARTGRIQVEEDEIVIDALLQHLYELKITLIDHEQIEDYHFDMQERMNHIVELEVAPDKYLIAGLRLPVLGALTFCLLQVESASTLTKIGSWVNCDLPKRQPVLAEMVARMTAGEIKEVMASKIASAALYANEKYLKRVMVIMVEGPLET